MPHSIQGLGAYCREQKREKLEVKTGVDYAVVFPCSCSHRQAQKQKNLALSFVKVGYFPHSVCLCPAHTVTLPLRRDCTLSFLSIFRNQGSPLISDVFHEPLLSHTQEFKYTTNFMLLFPKVDLGCSLLAAEVCTNLRISHEDEKMEIFFFKQKTNYRKYLNGKIGQVNKATCNLP